VIGVTFAMGVSLLSRMAFACQAKANLHPLAFYTIYVTSPLFADILTGRGIRGKSLHTCRVDARAKIADMITGAEYETLLSVKHDCGRSAGNAIDL